MTSADVIEAESFAKKQREAFAGTPCLILPLRTEAQARAEIAARPAYHPIRDMPSCQWSSVGHRYDFHREESGFTVEACMDCGKQRKYPVGTNSKHCVVMEFPASELDQLIGKESRL